jgi:hypothetical protein
MEADMPTILEILGWRLFFYSNEGNEPIHVHARKAEAECKYWIDVDNYDIGGIRVPPWTQGPTRNSQDHF